MSIAGLGTLWYAFELHRMPIDMNRRRIAFVYAPAGYPNDPARLEAMPFAISTIMRLALADCKVDVFLWEQPLVDYRERFPPNVRLRYQVTPKRIFYRTRPANLRHHPIRLTATFMSCTNYECAFGLGQLGSYLGAVISLASRCPLVILNDELPSHYGPNNRWAPLERWAAERADVIIVPSANQIPELAKELQLSDQRKKFVEFRNTPKVSRPLEQRDWHALLGIPSGKRIFLNAGSLGEWGQVTEILSSTVYWPSDAVLLLHSRTSEQGGLRQQLSHLHVPGRVFWTSAPLSEKLLNSLVAHCNGSFALYRNAGPYISLVGTASGKLMRSVVCGSPVIASSFDSLRFVSQEGIGVQVSHPSEIPAAIQELIRNEQAYREKCLSFARQEVLREQQSWEALVSALSSKIDLQS
jgi:glycosyltransferase involved in cell wall biosynthesis